MTPAPRKKARPARKAAAPPRSKGWDWTEILEAVGVDLATLADGENGVDLGSAEMNRRIDACFGCGEIVESDANRAFISACRDHVKACARTACYEAPLWEGLAKVEHDWTFLQLVRDLYPRMWT